MKKKITSIFILLLFLIITFYTPSVQAATDFYYPTNSEIDNAINSIKSEYPSGSKFNGSFDNGIECIGFAKYAFNRIWGVDCYDAYTNDTKYRFKLSSTSVVDEVGYLTGSSVTVNNLRNLFYNTPKGSLVQMSSNGQQHTMLFVSCDSNNISVLEANIDFNNTVSHSTISYSSLVSRCATSGNGVSTYKYNGKKNSASTIQNFGSYVHIVSKIGGKYLTASGNDVVMKSKNDGYEQIWKVVRNTDTSSKDYGSIKFISVENGKCLTMANNTGNNADIYLANDQELKTQKWYVNNMLPSTSNTYMLSTQAARTVIDVPGASNDENVAVAMYQDNRSLAQQFEFKNASVSDILNAQCSDCGENFIATIDNYDGTKYLTNKGTYTNFEENITSLAQLWRFERLNDGTYKISSLLDGKYLSPNGTTNGSSIGLSTSVFNWKINYFSGTYWNTSTGTTSTVYKSGYRFIHTSRPLIISCNSSSNAVLNSTVYTDAGMFKISKEYITKLSFKSGNDWVKVGETLDMSEQLSNSDCSRFFKKYVTWSVSDTSIATIDSNGKLTGKKAGTVTVTVTSKYNTTIKATKTINIGTKLESISLSSSEILLNKGQKQKLTVLYNPTSTTQNKAVTWSSNSTSIATVDSNGNVTAVKTGTATITAKVGELTAKCTVKVKETNPSTVEIEAYTSNTDVAVGGSTTVYLRINTGYSNIYKGKIRINFDSNIFEINNVASEYYYNDIFNPNAVTINRASSYVEFNYTGSDNAQNVVVNTARSTFFYISLKVKDNVTKYGNTPITLTTTDVRQSGGNVANVKCVSCNVNISSKSQSLKLDKTSITTVTGSTVNLTPILTPSNASKNLYWTTSNSSIASVSDGVVKIKNTTGTVNITAKTIDGTNLTATCIITVKQGITMVNIPYGNKILSKKGETFNPGVTVSPSNAENKTLKWTTSDAKVATVDANGTIKAVGNGNCVITVTATDGSGKSDQLPVTVNFPEQLVFTESGKTLNVGQTGQAFTEVLKPTYSHIEVVFTCSDESIVELTYKSWYYVTYTAKKAGTATITAKSKEDSTLIATYKVTVTEPKPTTVPLTSISLSKTALALTTGGTNTLTVTYNPTNTTDSKTVTWTTSNSKVATVSNGKITAVGAGTATITAKVGTKTATCKVTVTEPKPTTVPLTSISLSKTALALTTGGTSTLTVTYNPTNTTDSKTVTWTTSNSKVATVSNGKITAVGAGTATITAKVGTKTATCKVTVTEPKPTKAIPNVTYRTHVQNVGWQNYVKNGAMAGTSGRSLRLEGINIKLENNEYGGNITYQTHIQNIGWQDYVKDGVMSGTSGKSLRLEAIRINLTGEIAKYYDIYYRVHCQNFGWMDWAKNGESAGSAGYSYRLEGIEIRLVQKGEVAPGKTDAPFIQKYVTYQTHIQNIGWQDNVRDKEVSGTTGQALRLEGIKISLENPQYDGSIEYRTHVQNIGWQSYVKDGAMAGTSGRSLRLEAIQIRLTGTMAQKYDIYYRVHCQNFGWMGWAKNGESAGSAGYSYRLEGIQICIVKKGTSAPGSTANCFKSK